MDESRRISKEELASLREAVFSCTSWRLHDGLYEGESEGWRFVLSKEGGRYVGYALHSQRSISLYLPARVTETYYKHVEQAGALMKYVMSGMTYFDKIFEGKENEIFVFGSNRAGVHGAGAAYYARKSCGALQGVGEGRMGSSYAIPTKDDDIRTLPLEEISGHVLKFMTYAREHPELHFFVTRIGCGLAGYYDEQIAPLFTNAPDNVELPDGWRQSWTSNKPST